MTASPDERRFARALDRMGKAMFAMAAGGAVAMLLWGGWRWGAGWLLGCGASALNYRWLRRGVFSMKFRQPHERKTVLLGLRSLLLGARGYVILEYTAISPSGAP